MTVYCVRNEAGDRRFFTVVEGLVVEHADYKAAFGSMLDEPHPTMTIEVRGQLVQPGRFSLCWAPIEPYHPLTAEQLAALRESRERKKAEQKEQRFRQEHPLFANLEKSS